MGMTDKELAASKAKMTTRTKTMIETHDTATQKRWVANPMIEAFIQKFHRMMVTGESFYGNVAIEGNKRKPKPPPDPVTDSDTEEPDDDVDDITGGLFD